MSVDFAEFMKEAKHRLKYVRAYLTKRDSQGNLYWTLPKKLTDKISWVLQPNEAVCGFKIVNEFSGITIYSKTFSKNSIGLPVAGEQIEINLSKLAFMAEQGRELTFSQILKELETSCDNWSKWGF